MSMKIVTKSQMAAFIAQGRGHESFEHEELGHFDVTEMRELAKKKGELIEVDMAGSGMIEFVRTQRVYEEQRVHELPHESWHGANGQNDPVLYVRIARPAPEPTTYLLIDGAHRIMRRHLEGLTTTWAYVLEERDIIRPDWSKMGDSRDLFGLDWGDAVLSNGQIIKRG